MTNRRQLLQGAAGLGAGLFLPRPARAESVSATDLRFLFVFAQGGWDVTRVFAPAFDNPLVDMEAEAVPQRAGNIDYVNHPERPSVQAFMEGWHDRILILNGISVPSAGHLSCARLLMSGDASGVSADWPVLLSQPQSEQFMLPCVVVDGPQFPGTYGRLCTRIGTSGQMEALLTGNMMSGSDLPIQLPSNSTQARLDALLLERAAQRGQRSLGSEKALMEGFSIAAQRAQGLEGLVGQVAWNANTSLDSQLALAVDLLRLGVSRSVMTRHLDNSAWDSHSDNDAHQSSNFESLFASLALLMDTLENTPGPQSARLADQTVVVVLSEMGRTPQLSGGSGKDHWGTTSAMLIGPNLSTDRVVGGYSPLFYGAPLDPGSGELYNEGLTPTGSELGATLLALGGVDLPENLRNHFVLEGVLR